MKALASDFDGTLFFGEHEFKQSDIDAIETFQKAGNVFGLCTGRPLIGAIKITKQRIDYDFYIMSSGAVILDKDLHILYEKTMPRDIVKKISETYCKDYQVFIQANQIIYRMFDEKKINNQIKINSIDEIEGDHFYGVSLNGKTKENAAKLCKEINQIYPEVMAYQNIEYIDIVSKGCSKGNGIKKLKELTDIDYIGGIGDSYNDIPMLECVDLAFTFEHSPDDVKKVADKIVDSVAAGIGSMLHLDKD